MWLPQVALAALFDLIGRGKGMAILARAAAQSGGGVGEVLRRRVSSASMRWTRQRWPLASADGHEDAEGTRMDTNGIRRLDTNGTRRGCGEEAERRGEGHALGRFATPHHAFFAGRAASAVPPAALAPTPAAVAASFCLPMRHASARTPLAFFPRTLR